MNMKRILCVICMLLLLVGASAQADRYLNLAKQELDNSNCEAAQTFYDTYKRLSHDSVPDLERRIKDCFNPPKGAAHKPKGEKKQVKQKKEGEVSNILKDRDNAYCKSGRNRYIAWTIVGAGYPWNVTMGVELRAGGILGIGGYADIGVDISRYQFKYVISQDNDIISNKKVNVHPRFGYAGGVKLYYKGFFLSLGYGSISRVRPVSLEYDSVDDYWEHSDDDLSKIIKGHGVHINVGYNLCTSANGFFLGISGGIAYDVVNKLVVPCFNLKLGMTFDWKKY